MRDAAFVVATALVVWGAAGVAHRLRLGRRTDFVLATATLATLQVVASVLFAGLLLRRLSPTMLFSITVAWSGPIVWLTRDDVGLARFVGFVRRVRLRPLWTSARRHPWSASLALLAIVEFAWRAVISFAVLPYGWDALYYHLTTVATWVQDGRIEFVPFDLFSNIFPANGEVVTAWVATFTHSSIGLTGVQLPFGVLGALAVMSLARTVRVTRPGAIAAGSLFFLTPVVLAQTTSNYVDLMAAALVLTCLAFGTRAVIASSEDDAGLRIKLVILCGIAGGLAMGTKTTAIPYVAAVAVGLAVAEGRRHGLRRMPRVLIGFGLPAVVLGGFWFARVWVQYGNPLHPFRVSIGSIRLFNGTEPASRHLDATPAAGGFLFPPLRSWFHDLASWRPSARYTYDERLGGFGAVWVLVELPLLAVVTWISVRRRDAAFSVLTLLCVIGWLAQPYSWWTRFSMPLLAPGILALVIAVERLTGATARKALVLVSAGLVVVTAGLASVYVQTGSGDTISAAAIVRRALTPGLGEAERSGDPTSLRWLDALPANEAIAVETGPFIGTFFFNAFGEHLSRRLIPIEPNSPESLVAAMRASPATVLAAMPGSDVDQWATGDSRHFHLLPDLAPVAAMREFTLGRVYRFTE